MSNTVSQIRTNKDEEIKKALDSIRKDFGPGAILRLGDKVGQPFPCIPTGIWGVDHGVCGIGGLPQGRIVEAIGPESGGKTLLALRAIASAQRMGMLAAFIDAENAFDPNWAALNGVDVDNLLVSQPDFGEQALQIVETLIRSEHLGIVAIDSVAALVPRAELDGDIGDSNVGLQARLMSQFCRMIVGAANKTSTTVLFINQIREKIGVMYGSNETTSGGRALKHYSSLRLDVRKVDAIKEGDVVVGHHTRIRAIKNKLAAPFRQTMVDLKYTCGFDSQSNLFDCAVEAGVITRKGAYYNYKDKPLGQGKDNSIISMLDVQKEIMEALAVA